MAGFSGQKIIMGDEHKKYRIPACDIEKVKIISPFPFLVLDGIKDDNGWVEFSIPFGSHGSYFEYL